MGFYDAQVLPRLVDVVCGNKQMAEVRRPSLAALSGTVVELGFGSGPNVGLYPPAVERVLAVEPNEVARRRARKRIDGADVAIELIGLDGQSLPLEDGSVDAVLSTWTLCTIPDVGAALAEARRVLRPGGTLHVLEHGLSDDPRVAARQHRFTPIQKKVAGGCHLDRDIAAIVSAAGFRTDGLTTFTIRGPKTASFMYAGVAPLAD